MLVLRFSKLICSEPLVGGYNCISDRALHRCQGLKFDRLWAPTFRTCTLDLSLLHFWTSPLRLDACLLDISSLLDNSCLSDNKSERTRRGSARYFWGKFRSRSFCSSRSPQSTFHCRSSSYRHIYNKHRSDTSSDLLDKFHLQSRRLPTSQYQCLKWFIENN